MKEIISALDIGSCSVKLVVGEIYNGELNVLSASEVKSKGVSKGLITNPEEIIISLKEVFNRTEEMLGIKIKKVVLNIPTYYSDFEIVEGGTLIENEDGTVMTDDILECMQDAVNKNMLPGKEYVCISPIEYKINETKIVDDPKGMKAKSLSMRCVIGLSPKKMIYQVVSILENLGIAVVDINYGSISDYSEFKDKEMDKENSAIINIGHEKTEVSIFKKGILIDADTIEKGSKGIDNDLCYIYDIKKREARKLKEKFALASPKNASKTWCDTLVNNNEEEIKLSQADVSEVIYSRVKELLALSKKQINLLTNLEISNIIITGGISELNDFSLVVDEVFGDEASVYKISEIGCRHNKFSSCLGLIRYYKEKLAFREKIATTVDEALQEELLNGNKNKDGSVISKIYGYFFNN